MNILNIKGKSAQDLHELVSVYLNTVNQFRAELSHALDIKELSEWRTFKVPIKGKFNNSKWSYAFHGTGCWIASEKLEVDFEFGNNTNTIGFDVWRLWSFIEDNESIKEQYSEFRNKKSLESAFNALTNDGIISKGNIETGEELYYLSKN